MGFKFNLFKSPPPPPPSKSTIYESAEPIVESNEYNDAKNKIVIENVEMEKIEDDKLKKSDEVKEKELIVITDKLKKLKRNEHDIKDTTTEISEVVHLTIISTETILNLAEMVPLVGVVFVLIGKLVKQYKAYEELTSLLEDVGDLIKLCGSMAKLTMKTMQILESNITSFFSDQQSDESIDRFIKIIDSIKIFKIDASTGIKIITKLKQIQNILTKLDLDMSKNHHWRKKFGDFFIKSTQGTFYKELILKEMTMLNVLFGFFNNQLTWTLSMNEHFLKSVFKIENGNEIYLIDKIWDEIIVSKEFGNYWNQDENVNYVNSELIKMVQRGGRRRYRRRQMKSRGKKRTTRRLILRKTRKKTLSFIQQ